MFYFRFLDVSDFALVTEALKEHAVAVRRPPSIQALNVTSNPYVIFYLNFKK